MARRVVSVFSQLCQKESGDLHGFSEFVRSGVSVRFEYQITLRGRNKAYYVIGSEGRTAPITYAAFALKMIPSERSIKAVISRFPQEGKREIVKMIIQVSNVMYHYLGQDEKKAAVVRHRISMDPAHPRTGLMLRGLDECYPGQSMRLAHFG